MSLINERLFRLSLRFSLYFAIPTVRGFDLKLSELILPILRLRLTLRIQDLDELNDLLSLERRFLPPSNEALPSF